MRIAFCLSGGPRFKHRGLFRLVESLKGWDQADFFIRTWKTPEYGQTPEEFVNYIKPQLPDTCNFPVVQVLDDVPEHQPPFIPLQVAHWAPNFRTMWWGIKQSYELYKDYVAETGTEYDLVFRMRTDMVPGKYRQNEQVEIDLRDYVEQAKTHVFNAQNFGDNFLFGSPEMYDQLMGFWKYLSYLSMDNIMIHPEERLEQYLIDYKIPYQRLPWEVMPTHERDEYSVRHNIL